MITSIALIRLEVRLTVEKLSELQEAYKLESERKWCE